MDATLLVAGSDQGALQFRVSLLQRAGYHMLHAHSPDQVPAACRNGAEKVDLAVLEPAFSEVFSAMYPSIPILRWNAAEELDAQRFLRQVEAALDSGQPQRT